MSPTASSYAQIMEENNGDPETGILYCKGAYSGLHWTTVAFLELTGESMQDETLYANDGTLYDVFFLSDEDHAKYDIPDDIYAVVVHVDGDGNPYGDWFDEPEFSFFENEILASEELEYK